MWSNVYKCGLPCNPHAVVFAKARLKPAPVHNHTGRRKRCLGSFASEREAAEAYDKAALTLRSNTSPFFQLRIVCLVEGSVQKFAQYLVASQGTQRQLLCLLHALPFLVCLTHMSIYSDSNLFECPNFADLPCHMLLLSDLRKQGASEDHLCKRQQQPQLVEDRK